MHTTILNTLASFYNEFGYFEQPATMKWFSLRKDHFDWHQLPTMILKYVWNTCLHFAQNNHKWICNKIGRFPVKDETKTCWKTKLKTEKWTCINSGQKTIYHKLTVFRHCKTIGLFSSIHVTFGKHTENIVNVLSNSAIPSFFTNLTLPLDRSLDQNVDWSPFALSNHCGKLHFQMFINAYLNYTQTQSFKIEN